MKKCTMAQTMTARSTKATVILRITSSTACPKASVKRANPRLNQAKKPRCGGRVCFSMMPHMAGVRVRATKPEMATEMAMVMANCL